MQPQNIYRQNSEHDDIVRIPKNNHPVQFISNGGKLSKVTFGFGERDELRSFNVDNNKFDVFPKNLVKLARRLDDISFGNNLLASIPENIFQFRYLRSFNLSGNFLGDLPASFSKLNLLERLNLSNNYFSSVPSHLSKLKKLQVLNMANNNLKEFICTDGFLELEDLNLSGNEIKKVDNNISKIPKLKILNFRKNRLVEFIYSGGYLKLEELDISINEIENIDSSLSGLANIKNINISSNLARRIPRQLSHIDNIAKNDYQIYVSDMPPPAIIQSPPPYDIISNMQPSPNLVPQDNQNTLFELIRSSIGSLGPISPQDAQKVNFLISQLNNLLK